MINAGNPLVAVTAFGLTTAANYAFSGLVDWTLAGVFIAGGALGSLAGTKAAKRLSNAGHLSSIYRANILCRGLHALGERPCNMEVMGP